MSVKLEQGGVYLLPDAVDGEIYAVLEAQRTADGWQLVECHATPFGPEAFQRRATLPPEEQLRYRVDADGALLQEQPSADAAPTRWTVANLSLLGRMRDGALVLVESQQREV